MNNGEYQRRRVKTDGTFGKLNAAINERAVSEGTTYSTALLHVLIDMRHLCDVNDLAFGELDKDAHEGYLEELGWLAAGQLV